MAAAARSPALSYATKWGVFRFGLVRVHQHAPLPDLHRPHHLGRFTLYLEHQVPRALLTYATQPYAEFQLVSIPRWTITAGLKDAYYPCI
jgi:hypothetical protein